LSPILKNKTLPFVSYLFPSSGETTNPDKQLKTITHLYKSHAITKPNTCSYIFIFSLTFLGLAYVEFIFLDVRVVPGVSFVMACLLFLWSILSLKLMVSPEERSNGF